jgi:hypothetical protein
MGPNSTPTVESSVAAWVAGDRLSPQGTATEVARLRRLGFVAGITENLVEAGNPNRYGLSLLEQFISHSGAEAELAHTTSPSAPGGPWTHFAVSGIPGAYGFESLSGSQSGRNIAFVEGSNYYLEGAGWNAPASNAVSRAQLAAAALLVYHRMRGK